MSCLDIKDPTKRAAVVNEYDTAMKTVKLRNMTNREMKLAIGDELQALFHPIVNATKQAAKETVNDLAAAKKALTDIDGALLDQPVAAAEVTVPPASKPKKDPIWFILETRWKTRYEKQSSVV